jgi:serine O-acetyltransferase
MSWRTRFSLLRDDVRVIFQNDPAARNLAEVLLYPGLHAILLHRVAHALWVRRVPFIPRLISQIARFFTDRDPPRRADRPRPVHRPRDGSSDR